MTSSPASFLRRLQQLLGAWLAGPARLAHDDLRQLDERALRDIGLEARATSRTLVVLASAVILGACAGLPDPVQPPEMKAADRYATERSFSAPPAPWPADAWWQVYGDSQLDALVAEALAGSPSLAIAQARLAQAQAGVVVSQAAGAPKLSANASLTEQKQSYNYLVPRGATPQGWNDYGRATLDFSWEIDFWGKNRAALAAATSEAQAAAADSAQARLLLTTALASAYADFARLQAAWQTAEAARDVRSRTVDQFQRRHANGLETLASVRQVEALRATAEAELLSIGEQITLARHRIAAIVGAGPDRGLALAPPAVDLARPFGLPAQLSAQLLGRRPDIVAARLRAEAAAQRIDQARASFYPNVNLLAFVGVQSLGLNMLRNNGSAIGSIGPAISLPIFDGGRLRGRLGASEAEYAQAVASYDGTLAQALQDVADAAASRMALDGRLARVDEAVAASRETWQMQSRRYAGGLSSYLEVLSAEDEMLANLRSQTDLRARSLLLDVALVRALGGGYRADTHQS